MSPMVKPLEWYPKDNLFFVKVKSSLLDRVLQLVFHSL